MAYREAQCHVWHSAMCGTTDSVFICASSCPQCTEPLSDRPCSSRAVPCVSLLKPYEPDNWSDSISPAGDLGSVRSMDRQFVSRCNIRRPLWVPVAPFQCRPYIKRAAAISLMSSPRVLAAHVLCKSGIWHTWSLAPHNSCVPRDAYSKQPLFSLQHPSARCVLCGIFVSSLGSR